MKVNILMVEDDSKISEIVSDFFTGKSQGNMRIHVVSDGNKALDELYEKDFDLVLLDIMLPGIDGFSICKEIRRKSTTPIMFITAKGREEDKLYGYSLGCDDYIVKPFSIEILYAKVSALIKREKGMVNGDLLTAGNISLNPHRYQVFVNDREIDLPPKEYALLKFFMDHKEQVIERDDLLIRIWGYDYEGSDRVVDNHVKKLRRALGEEGSCIKTVFMKGYRLTVSDNEKGD